MNTTTQEMIETFQVYNGRHGYADDQAAEHAATTLGVPVEHVKAAVEGHYLGRETASRMRRDEAKPSFEYQHGVFPFVTVPGFVIVLPGGVVAEDKKYAKPAFYVRRADATRARGRLAKWMRPAAVAPCTRIGDTFTVDAGAGSWA